MWSEGKGVGVTNKDALKFMDEMDREHADATVRRYKEMLQMVFDSFLRGKPFYCLGEKVVVVKYEL